MPQVKVVSSLKDIGSGKDEEARSVIYGSEEAYKELCTYLKVSDERLKSLADICGTLLDNAKSQVDAFVQMEKLGLSLEEKLFISFNIGAHVGRTVAESAIMNNIKHMMSMAKDSACGKDGGCSTCSGCEDEDDDDLLEDDEDEECDGDCGGNCTCEDKDGKPR